MSTATKQPNGVIPQWVFVLALVLLLGGIGISRLTKEIKRSAHPVISEIHTLNRNGLTDEDGDRVDWIEIWNPTQEAIDLQGYSLSDDFRQLRKWRFPSVRLAPGEFLVVFASGKNRTNAAASLHTNFKLNPDGEYLVLVAPGNSSRVHEFLPRYPRQIGDISFGIRPEFFQSEGLRLTRKLDDMSFLLEPTPGRPNEIEMLGAVKPVKFSVRRGYHDAPVRVALSVETRGADIRFTLDGTRPSGTNGVLYVEPIEVNTTTTLRAVSYRAGFQRSAISSHTYIFPGDVVRSLAPVPDDIHWNRGVAGLDDLPTMSLLLDETDAGRNDERAASMEWMEPGDGTSKQVDCGIRVVRPGPANVGIHWKNSFQLLFEDRFGDPEFRQPLFGKRKPRSFKRLMLLGGAEGEDARSSLASLVADTWTRVTLQELDLHASRSRFVHLFLNGAYRGIYNLAEQPESPFVDFGEANTEPKYDVRTGSGQIAGDAAAWNVLNASLSAVMQGTAPTADVERQLNMDSLIDYSLVQLFSHPAGLGQTGNWLAYRRRGVSTLFEFGGTFDFAALQESGYQRPMAYNWEGPARILSVLARDQAFQAACQRRAGELTASGAPLGEDRALERLRHLSTPLADARVMESLRWGTGEDALEQLDARLQERLESFAARVQARNLLDRNP